MLKILFIGDIVGKPGRKIIKNYLQEIIKEEEIDLTIANSENAAGGFGITYDVSQEILGAGVDLITLGNHTWDNRDIDRVLEEEPRVIRPANYPEGTPGQGYSIIETAKGVSVGVINLLGQVYLEALRCPFRMADECINKIKKKTNVIVVDFHAETTSEKMALGWYLDGRVTAVLGTHTHIPTADARVLPKGTAYITDAGMTGPLNSVLGIDPEIVITKFLTKRPIRFEVASGPVKLDGVIFEVNEYGLATSIKRIQRLFD